VEPDAGRAATNFSAKTRRQPGEENQRLVKRIRKRRWHILQMLYVNVPVSLLSMIAKVNSFGVKRLFCKLRMGNSRPK
jgi:hypothetical protein